MLRLRHRIVTAALLWCAGARAEEPPPPNLGALAPATPLPQNPESERHWYDRIHIRGYSQLRYSRIGATNPHLTNRQADRGLGAEGGFTIRRARLILSADVASFLSVLIQPDFVSAFEDFQNTLQLRDWYADIFLDPSEKMFRFRVGQSRVPYGWELLQSSRERLPLDRTDGINSAFVNERDIGAFFYFETPAVRRRFKRLVDSGLKGSGDFGITAIGIANGQPLNTRERNDNKAFFARVAYPLDVGSQTVELAAAAYTNRAVVNRDEGVSGRNEEQDFRALGTFVWYPQPLGFQAEYNIGYGPELVGKKVERRPLDGGYAMVMYRQPLSWGAITPYARAHRYDGGKKFETNSPRYEVKQLDLGIELQITRWLELTTELLVADRKTNGDRQTGRAVRLQLQFSF